MLDSKLIAAKPAAKIIGLPYTTLRKLALAGRLDIVRVGRAWYFIRADLDKLVDRLRETVGQ